MNKHRLIVGRRPAQRGRGAPGVLWLLALVVAAALAWQWHSGRSTAVGAVVDPPVPVRVAAVTRATVPVYLAGLGTVVAAHTVAIKPRVEGEILEILFDEGQEVEAGQLLLRLDPTLYQAALRQAEAGQRQHEAQLTNARAELRRLQAVKDHASRSTVEAQRARVAELEASIAADQARMDEARAQLDYTEVRSPIAGRTGLRQVDVGNLVRPGDTQPIVTVSQLQPVAVLFSVSADRLPEIQRGLRQGPLPVLAYGRDRGQPLARGNLALFDNQIDPDTGTIRLKALFDNHDLALWPGQFVNARLEVARHADVLTVPEAALQQGPDGAFVWRVDDGAVAMQAVVPGPAVDGQVMVDGGLRAGDSVVVEGQFRLRPGSAVTLRPAAPGDPA